MNFGQASMEPWQERLKQETLDLVNKVHKLHDYMRTGAFYNLPRIDKNLLYEQEQHMMSYLKVLGARCELYGIKLYEEVKDEKDYKPGVYPGIDDVAGKL